MDWEIRRKLVIPVMLLFAFLFSFVSESPALAATYVFDKNSGEAYNQIFLEWMDQNGQSDVSVNMVSDGVMQEFSLGADGAEVFDLQAEPYLRNMQRQYFFYPHFMAEVVLAVAPDADVDVKGWKDLMESDATVSVTTRALYQEYFCMAMGYGLSHKWDGEAGIRAMRRLYREGRLMPDNSWGSTEYMLSDSKSSADVYVLFDYQAAQTKIDGKPLRIIVPEEGTLTVQKGMLTKRKLPAKDSALMKRLCQEGYGCTAYLREMTPQDNETFRSDIFYLRQQIKRDVYGIRGLMVSGVYETLWLYIILVPVIIFWGGSIYYRLLQAGTQRAMNMLLPVLLGLLLLRVVSFTLPLHGNTLLRYAWYGYYIFLFMIPALVIWMAAESDRAVFEARMPWFIKALFLMNGLVTLFVLSNDFHQQIFIFQPGFKDSTLIYAYGWGIYFIKFVEYGEIGIALLVFARRAFKQRVLSIKGLLPVAVLVLLILFHVGYALRIPLVRHTELVAANIIFVLAFIEACMQSGLLHANEKYLDLFSHSGLGMEIHDIYGRKVYEAPQISDVPPENLQVRSMPIHGGTVIWKKDISWLKKNQKELAMTARALQRAYDLLYHRKENRREMLAYEVQQRLYQELEAVISAKRPAMEKYVRIIERAGEDVEGLHAIQHMNILASYLKKRCVLLLKGKSSTHIPAGELWMALDETGLYAEKAGVKNAIRFQMEGGIETQKALVLYDFFYELMNEAVARQSDDIVFSFLEQDGCKCICLLPEKYGWTEPWIDRFLRPFALQGGHISCKDLEYAFAIEMSVK